MAEKKLTVRIYGLCIDDNNNILVTDEKVGDFYFTKFPGGGLEWGEGTRDCLVREFKEELNVDVEVQAHFYTTDYFQPSAWNSNQQILSIYYKVKILSQLDLPISTEVQTLDANIYETEKARLVPLSQLTEDMLTLPIDKCVCTLLRNNMSDIAK
jgi:8-oxo-dGTP diphosphatase